MYSFDICHLDLPVLNLLKGFDIWILTLGFSKFMIPRFTHLHVHSQYSLLDGLPKIEELLNYVKENDMESVAITDHGVLYGAVEFYKKAKQAGIKPIIGSEIYTALEGMTQKRPNIDNKRYHLVLLVKNETGYRNLVKLVTKAHLEGFYYKPRIDEELLFQHTEGLIALSACLQGKIPRLIISGRIEEAEKTALKYQEAFGKGNFYLEIQHHPNISEQIKANKILIELSKKHGIPLVATNDCHYLRPEDAEAQDILMLINTGAKPDDPDRLTMRQDDFSMTPPKEMIENFKDVPEALANTQKIVQACNFEFKLGEIKLPHFPMPNQGDPDEYLRDVCEKRFEKRKKEFKNEKEAKERMAYELGVVKKTGFASYFLIVADFVEWAKENKIVVGPGRGSVGSSLVAYLTNITNINPLQHNLLFERFLTSERISPPDIDLDFADTRRDEVIEYVSQKYGQDRVAQIITFGTMAARAAIRDVGRVLKYPYSVCDKIAKMIPFGFNLDQTLKQIPEFREAYESDEQIKRLVDLSKKLEGVARHASTHACGVVISAEPLDTLVPVQRPTQNDDNIITQYEMHSIEDLGLLKMDFLGLKNLTMIEDTIKLVGITRGKKIEINEIPQDDKKTYKLLQKAETTSIFQLESSGMKKWLRQLQPSNFEDISTMLALYRPGPMQFIPEYVARKQKRKKIAYLHPKLKPILESTYGLPVFQEQMMQIAREIAGFSLSEADTLRKAIGKKIPSLLHEQKEKFISGAIKQGIEKGIAQKIWGWFLPFAQYGFNKCLTGDTEIISATGNIRTIENIYQESKLKRAYRNIGKSTISLGKNFKFDSGKILRIIQNGKKAVYEIETLSGRKIRATKEHRFLLFSGWKKLKELNKGDRLAIARFWPINKMHKIEWPWHKITLLGYVLSEGNTCQPNGFYLYTNSEEEMKEYVKILEKFNNTKATVSRRMDRNGGYAVYAGRIDLKQKSEAVEWIMNNLNLKYKKTTQKVIPLEAFRLNNNGLSVLLGSMWNGDGCISPNQGFIYYATSSENLAKQIQALLLRFGILSKLHKKKFNYRNTVKTGWTISLSRYDNLLKFAENIGPHLIAKRKRDLKRLLDTHSILKNGKSSMLFARGTLDTVPAEVIIEIRNECQRANIPMKTVADWAGVSYRLFQIDCRKKGLQRETLYKIANILNSERLKNIAESDIYWDKIKSIKYIGKEQTYDLTIRESHNFVANGFIVHNSHSTGYGIIAYQTAYLKANFPVEFMAAVLASEKQDVERIAFLLEECKRMNIDVLPPDINESFKYFTVVDKNKIRFGLLAIKNVGHNIVQTIVDERAANGKYQSIGDFVNKIHSKDLNKKSMEALIKAGAFDKLEERNMLLGNLERLLSCSREIQNNKKNGQKGLFDGSRIKTTINLEPMEPASAAEKLQWEKELLGLFVSGHPLETYQKSIAKKAVPILKILQELTKTEDQPGFPLNVPDKIFKKITPGTRLKICGLISRIKKIITKSGRPMFFVKIQDLTGEIEAIIFPNSAEQYANVLRENKIVLVSGRVDFKDDSPKMIVEGIEEIIEE
ncbi:DNA polymerase III subunit alpha [Patescibacteria group bacterium]|nr:DNA polymerase III subunit alpha [Patescibacteria group bacterium]